MIGAEPLCTRCLHLHDQADAFDTEDGAWTCDAFPEGIPEGILFGEIDHTQPVEGDHGIQYEEGGA